MLAYKLREQIIHRVGYIADPWELAPWRYGPFKGRWCDPKSEFRVRYVAFSRFGAFLERLAIHRPDVDLLLEGSKLDVEDPIFSSLEVFPTWLSLNAYGRARLELLDSYEDLVDLTTGDGIRAAYPAIEHACRKSSHRPHDFDAATLLSANPRKFTQALSRYFYENGFGGIVYRSRFAPEEICLGLFEGRHIVDPQQYNTIDADDSDLLHACDIHMIPIRRLA